jgi:hypothetical protein
MKQCTRCKELKPLTDFYKNRSKKDGYDCCCKECAKIKQKLYYIKRIAAQNKPYIERDILDNEMCRILKYHKNEIGNDDERLHTQFIVDVINHKI